MWWWKTFTQAIMCIYQEWTFAKIAVHFYLFLKKTNKWLWTTWLDNKTYCLIIFLKTLQLLHWFVIDKHCYTDKHYNKTLHWFVSDLTYLFLFCTKKSRQYFVNIHVEESTVYWEIKTMSYIINGIFPANSNNNYQVF